MKKPENLGKVDTWIELASDGAASTSHAYLVISVGDGKQFRYEIPNVVEARWECTPPGKPRIELVIEEVTIRSRVAIRSDSIKAEDLLTEIAASHLAHEDGGK